MSVNDEDEPYEKSLYYYEKKLIDSVALLNIFTSIHVVPLHDLYFILYYL